MNAFTKKLPFLSWPTYGGEIHFQYKFIYHLFILLLQKIMSI